MREELLVVLDTNETYAPLHELAKQEDITWEAFLVTLQEHALTLESYVSHS